MTISRRSSGTRVENLGVRARNLLISYRPRFKERDFWIVQCLILVIVVLHALVEMDVILAQVQTSDFVPSTLFFVPVAYAAIKYGFAGSVATAIWATVLTAPNLVLLHHGLSLLGEVIQFVIVNAAAVFLGYWVGRERAASERAKAYVGRLVDAQEKERQRISRDLHDESIQTMVLLSQQLDAVKDSSLLPPQTLKNLMMARTTAEKAASELRDFAKQLRPPVLDDLGVVVAIRGLLIDLIERTGADGRFEVEGTEQRLPMDLELAMFRITQEGLSNVERHAEAKHVLVTVSFADSVVTLEIQDDGKGFSVPLKQQTSGGGLGLTGMAERAGQFGGKLDVESSPGKGTRIRATIPLIPATDR